MSTQNTASATKTRTITLTDHAPVKIREDEWPVVAIAKTWTGGNGVECQANEEMSIRVREHADGRRIVYGVRQAGPGGMAIGYRGAAGGSLVPAVGGKADQGGTVKAIRMVADEVIDDVQLGDECIADLPAEEI
jgi:hypothetical protein